MACFIVLHRVYILRSRLVLTEHCYTKDIVTLYFYDEHTWTESLFERPPVRGETEREKGGAIGEGLH